MVRPEVGCLAHTCARDLKLGKGSLQKKNGEIWELFPIGWVGLHPVPNFLTGFKKHSECSETHYI